MKGKISIQSMLGIFNAKATFLLGLVVCLIVSFILFPSHKKIPVDPRPNIIYIMADEARLYDLIHNLIDNAIKYTDDYGKITLAVELKDNKVRLTVEDNGVGIPKENQTMIYERFYRGDNVNTAGAGVGLSIVKDIADFHQATIEIDSRNSKEGTSFYIDFNLMKS